MGSAMGQPQSSGDTALKAIWLMGRKVGGTRSRDEDAANSKTSVCRFLWRGDLLMRVDSMRSSISSWKMSACVKS